jgi:hypothetical protein
VEHEHPGLEAYYDVAYRHRPVQDHLLFSERSSTLLYDDVAWDAILASRVHHPSMGSLDSPVLVID